MEGHCSTDQSPQWTVVPMEEEEEEGGGGGGNASSDTFSYCGSILQVTGYGPSFMRFLDAPQSVGLLWTIDHLATETST